MRRTDFSRVAAALQNKLNEEKSARQRSEAGCQEKDRQMSMLGVDYRQMQQRLQKLEGEHRQESEKVTLRGREPAASDVRFR